LLALLSGYAWLLQRRWPLEIRREELSVGGAWAPMTVGARAGGHGRRVELPRRLATQEHKPIRHVPAA